MGNLCLFRLVDSVIQSGKISLKCQNMETIVSRTHLILVFFSFSVLIYVGF